MDAVARSLEQFGFRQPIVVDAEEVIIVGHTRWKAARRLGLETVLELTDQGYAVVGDSAVVTKADRLAMIAAILRDAPEPLTPSRCGTARRERSSPGRPPSPMTSGRGPSNVARGIPEPAAGAARSGTRRRPDSILPRPLS